MTSHDRPSDEETPLLSRRKPKTPLPWGQMSIIFVALVAEPITSMCILPFINQLISELGVTGGDDRKIGYYAGLIESLFFVTQALTTWQWSRLSDFIGRRPVVLVGLLGLSVSNIAFGLSRTLVTLIASRCIAGVLNGNVGVMKSMLGDITDETNMAQVFAIILPVFGIGTFTASLYGGILAKPQERWPHVFPGEFWATYPYFLPCFVSGCFTLLTFMVCASFLRESLPSKTGRSLQPERPTLVSMPDNPPADDGRPAPISILLKTRSVMLPIANYGVLALVEISCLALLPLFHSSPIAIGGLGFPPAVIGTFLAISGIVNGSLQAIFSPMLIDWFGPKKVFCSAVLGYFPLILLFPAMTATVTAQGKVGPITWILLIFQLIIMTLTTASYVSIFMFITRAAPNKQSLGSTNGLSQSLVSIARAIGPAFATSLFAFSKQYDILGGNLVYVVLAFLATTLVALSQCLPDLKLEA